MTKKQYTSVAEMTRALADDQQFSEALEKRIADRKIIKQLIALRSAKGLSQTDIAKSMNCTQSRISKLEAGIDDDLRLGDLEGYLLALGLSGRLLISKTQQEVCDVIKYHWQCLGHQLDKLLDLAKYDGEIAAGVGKFSNEIAYNYMTRIFGFINRLPSEARTLTHPLGIEVEELDLPASEFNTPPELTDHCESAS